MVGRRVILVLVMGIVGKTFWNGVVAEPAGKRMAAREALSSKPDAAQDAEAFDGLVSVLRAGGLEAAGAGEEDGEIGFVAAESEESESNRKILRRTSGGRGTKTEVRATGSRSRSRSHHSVLRSLSSSVVRTGKGAVATLGLG